MKLFLLLPNMVLFTISFYNLLDGFSAGNHQNIVITLLHVFVMLICVLFTGMIVKSMFTIKSVEVRENRQENTMEVTA